jgi:hypothetical protein
MDTAYVHTDMSPGCSVCGKIPTLALPIRRHVGMVVIQQFVKINPPLCRTHGVETTKSFLKRTSVQGWWGVISFPVNVFVVISDLAVLRRFRTLVTPERKPRAAGTEDNAGMWLNDHFQRAQFRWFGPDGWTDAVATNGFVSSDPPGWR